MTATWPRMALSLVFLFAVWLVWSGYFKPLLLGLGVVSCVLVLWLTVRMGMFEEQNYLLRVMRRLPRFWVWLIGEVVVSNIKVARIILSPRPRMTPTLVTIKALAPDPLGQAILGNSITLTPGTVTLDDHEGELLVHCVTQEDATALADGEMNRRVAALTRD